MGYIVNITHGEILHIGQSITNLFLSEGDTQITSSYISINDNSVRGDSLFNHNISAIEREGKFTQLSAYKFTDHHIQLWSEYFEHTRQYSRC